MKQCAKEQLVEGARRSMLAAALRALCLGVLVVGLAGCAGYDVKVGLDYEDQRGDKIGADVDVSKEIITPKLEASGTGGFAK